MSARRGRAMPVIYAPAALEELDAVWDWNEKHYGRSRAADYVDFLERRIDALSENHQRGRTVESRPEYRYILIRRKAQGHGHVAVYRCDDKEIHVLHVFHTAQDWQTALAEERPDE